MPIWLAEESALLDLDLGAFKRIRKERRRVNGRRENTILAELDQKTVCIGGLQSSLVEVEKSRFVPDPRWSFLN